MRHLYKGLHATDKVDRKAGGAGLGFFQILDSLSHFVINLEKGKRTEMIGLIDLLVADLKSQSQAIAKKTRATGLKRNKVQFAGFALSQRPRSRRPFDDRRARESPTTEKARAQKFPTAPRQ